MSKKTSSKKTTTATKSSKKTTKPATKKTASAKAKKPVDPVLEAMMSGVPMVARAMSEQEQAEFTGATRTFPGAALPPKAKVATPKAEKTDKAPRVTVTSVAEDLIRAGRTDEEVLEALSLKFTDFDTAKKKHYPSWYRARLVRDCEITKAFADTHRHAKPSRDVPARPEA